MPTLCTFRRGYSTVVDTALQQAAPTVNTGLISQAIIGWTSGLGGQKVRLCLRFDLTGLMAGAIATAATLTIQNTGSSGAVGDGIYYARRLTQADWGETTATWNKYDGASAWTAGGGDYTATDEASCTIAAAADDLTFNVTTLVQDAIANRSRLLQLLIMQRENAQGEQVAVYTSDDATEANRPALQVTLAGEPDVVWRERGLRPAYQDESPLARWNDKAHQPAWSA